MSQLRENWAREQLASLQLLSRITALCFFSVFCFSSRLGSAIPTPYLIFVIYSTQTRFLDPKLYTHLYHYPVASYAVELVCLLDIWIVFMLLLFIEKAFCLKTE